MLTVMIIKLYFAFYKEKHESVQSMLQNSKWNFALSGIFANDNDVLQYYQKKPQPSESETSSNTFWWKMLT